MTEAAGRPDARTERWREHRIKVRGEIVDAVFRAAENLGPDISMDDIAREAGAAKPKLYRHFTDKSDIYHAVVDRLIDMLWARMVDEANLLDDTTAEVLHHGVDQYLQIVTQYPNTIRFVAHSGIAIQVGQGAEALQRVRSIAERMETLIASLAGDAIEPGGLVLVTFSVLGAGASATEWWMGGDELAMSAEKFGDYLRGLVTAIVQQGARLYGVEIDLSRPLPLAITQVRAAI